MCLFLWFFPFSDGVIQCLWRLNGNRDVRVRETVDMSIEHTFIWLIYLFSHYFRQTMTECGDSLAEVWWWCVFGGSCHHHTTATTAIIIIIIMLTPNQQEMKSESKAKVVEEYFGFCGFSLLDLFPSCVDLAWIDRGWWWFDVILFFFLPSFHFFFCVDALLLALLTFESHSILSILYTNILFAKASQIEYELQPHAFLLIRR